MLGQFPTAGSDTLCQYRTSHSPMLYQYRTLTENHLPLQGPQPLVPPGPRAWYQHTLAQYRTSRSTYRTSRSVVAALPSSVPDTA
eukprot:2153098-Rhodomonas_salina.4